MRRTCEGYCKGYANVENMRTVAGGERFCQMCYGEYLRLLYNQ